MAPLSAAERQAILSRARDLFNSGEYWLAHEALETVWRSIIRDGDDDVARVWQGLIQAAAALLHLERGNRHGVAAVGGAALEKLAGPLRPDVEFEIEGFRAQLAKPLDLELDVRSERARQLLQRRPPDGCDPVPVAALQMQQRRRGLDQPLPDACRVVVAVPNNRTPDSFQGFVSEPVFPGVEQVTGTAQDGLTLCR